jgi:hypothetical protein
MFEPGREALLSARRFARRTLKFILVGAAVDIVVVAVGAAGFHFMVGLGWLDSVVDAAMVATGNGPRHMIPDPAGKVFLSIYALVGGTAYIMVVALVLSPAVHRLLHIFHLRSPEDS